MMIAADAKGLMTSYALLNRGFWLDNFKPSPFTYKILVPFNESLEDFLSNPNSRLKRNDFQKSVKQLHRSVKLSINNKLMVRIILDYANNSSITKKYSFPELFQLYYKLKQVGIGTPKFNSLKEIEVAEKLIFIHNQEKKNLQKIKKEQKKIKFNQNVIHDKKYGTDKDINNNYYKIRQISDFYDGLTYGNFWQAHFKLTKKQFDKLALIVSAQVPHYSSVKWDPEERLTNAVKFLTIKYARSSAHSFRQVTYDPINDDNFGTYVADDNQLKALLYRLNPGASVNQINNLFEKLSDTISEITTEFHEHTDTPDLVIYNNGALNRKTGKLLPINSDLNITIKLNSNYDSNWLRYGHLPPKDLIDYYGFYNLMIKLANNYHVKGYENSSRWKNIEYPFSNLHLSNQIRKFNPFRYLYLLSNKRKKRMICLIQCLLTPLLTLWSCGHMLIFNSSTGKRGKSTALDIVQRIIGLENCSHTSLQDLGDDRSNFTLSSLLGSAACITNETSKNGYISDNSVIKELSTSEALEVPIKYQAPIKKTFRLTFMGSTNNGVKFKNGGNSSADLRRFIIINFNNKWITKHGGPNFRKKVINNNKVISYFAAFLGLCVPSFSKYAMDPHDLKLEKKNFQDTNSAVHFINNELIPKLILANKCGYIGKSNDNKPQNNLLIRIPKRLVFFWYLNSTEKPFGITKFIKSCKSRIADLPIKLAQRTIRNSDCKAYKLLVDNANDNYLPTSKSYKHKYDISKDEGHVKRCFVIDPLRPLFKGNATDMKLEPKFKHTNSAEIKSNGNVVTIYNITNGVAVVSGLINSKPTKYRWINLSKLTPVISQSSRHLLEIKELSSIKAKIWHETKQMDLELFIKDKYLNNHYLRSDLRTIKFGLERIKSLKGLASGLKKIYDKLYLGDNKFVIKKLGKLDLSNDRLGRYGVTRNTY